MSNLVRCCDPSWTDFRPLRRPYFMRTYLRNFRASILSKKSEDTRNLLRQEIYVFYIVEWSYRCFETWIQAVINYSIDGRNVTGQNGKKFCWNVGTHCVLSTPTQKKAMIACTFLYNKHYHLRALKFILDKKHLIYNTNKACFIN